MMTDVQRGPEDQKRLEIEMMGKAAHGPPMVRMCKSTTFVTVR